MIDFLIGRNIDVKHCSYNTRAKFNTSTVQVKPIKIFTCEKSECQRFQVSCKPDPPSVASYEAYSLKCAQNCALCLV